VSDVVHDPDREVVARALAAHELVEDRLHLGGGEVLRGEPVAPADHDGVDGESGLAGLAGLADRRHHVEVEGSPTEPGSLVRSSTAIARTVGGRAAAKCFTENGR